MSYDITTTVGKIRLIIGDKDDTDEVFTDAEITYFYSTAGSINLAAAMALKAWAASYSANADSEKIGDYSYTQKIVDKMLALAERLRTDDAKTPYFTWAEMDLSGVEDTTIDEDIE